MTASSSPSPSPPSTGWKRIRERIIYFVLFHVVCVLVGVGVPAFVADQEGAMTDEKVECKARVTTKLALPKSSDCSEEMDAGVESPCHVSEQDDLTCDPWQTTIVRMMGQVEGELANHALKQPGVALLRDHDAVARARELVKLHGELNGQKQKRSKLRFNGFYLHNQLLLYTWMYSLLGGLLLARICGLNRSEPKQYEKSRWRTLEIALLAILLSLAVRWPHFVHWLWSPFPGQLDRERRVYSFVHGELFPYSFWTNQVLFALVCLIVSTLSFGWLDDAVAVEKDAKSDLVAAANQLSRAFHAWKITSAVVAMAFLYASVLYWRLIWQVGDMRYLPSALLVHVLWAFTWFCATAPLMASWDRWHVVRVKFLEDLKGSESQAGGNDPSAEKIGGATLVKPTSMAPSGAWSGADPLASTPDGSGNKKGEAKGCTGPDPAPSGQPALPAADPSAASRGSYPLGILEHLQPVSVLSLTGSVVVAAASFFAPIIDALLRLP